MMFVFQFSFKEPESVERLKGPPLEGVTIVKIANQAQKRAEENAFALNNKTAGYLEKAFARA